jgi:uncharacterized protein
MLMQPLPNTLDVRKAAARGVSLSGTVEPADLGRLAELLQGKEGSVQADISLSKDEENRFLIHVVVAAQLTVTCQRCLSGLAVSLATENTIAVVWTDEQAGHLPRYLDALVCANEDCNLWELVEDELILSLPAFNYHETQECKELLIGYAPPILEDQDGDKPNPFNVLAQLKPSKKH